MTKPPPVARAIAAANEATGTRWCISCNAHRKTEGGKIRRGANGRRIWRCATCTARANPMGFR